MFKELVKRAESLFTKDRVRTPAGARRYGQPIGSIIVRDPVTGAVVRQGKTPDVALNPITGGSSYPSAARRKAERIFDIMPRKKGEPPPAPPKAVRGTSHLWSIESDYDGYEMMVDSRNVKFYVAKDEVGWAVWDSNNELVAEGNSRIDALRELDEAVAPPLKSNMRWATDADRKRLVIPPAWRDVMVSEDENTALQAVGYDAKGRGQYRYTNAHRENKDAEKFNRMKKLNSKMPKLDRALKENVGQEANDCLMMIRNLGMRPDSDSDSGADVETFGATSLQAKHVRVTDTGLVVLNFTPGKKKEPVTIRVRDKALADMLRERLKTRSRNDLLFDTNVNQISKYFRSVVGPGDFKIKDLRTLKANALALAQVKKKGAKIPQTKTEYRKWRKEVATAVSEVLGNTPTIALNSYISPAVFSDWLSDPSWA